MIIKELNAHLYSLDFLIEIIQGLEALKSSFKLSAPTQPELTDMENSINSLVQWFNVESNNLLNASVNGLTGLLICLQFFDKNQFCKDHKEETLAQFQRLIKDRREKFSLSIEKDSQVAIKIKVKKSIPILQKLLKIIIITDALELISKLCYFLEIFLERIIGRPIGDIAGLLEKIHIHLIGQCNLEELKKWL